MVNAMKGIHFAVAALEEMHPLRTIPMSTDCIQLVVFLPENEMIVLTTTGCTGSPSVAISTRGCPWMVS